VLQQKKLLSPEKGTQLQKKILKVKGNVRIYSLFFKLTFDTKLLWRQEKSTKKIISKLTKNKKRPARDKFSSNN